MLRNFRLKRSLWIIVQSMNDWDYTPLFVRYFLAPLVLICLAVGIPAIVLIIRGYKREQRIVRREKGECEQCGYLLYGLPEQRCPECGTHPDQPLQ